MSAAPAPAAAAPAALATYQAATAGLDAAGVLAWAARTFGPGAVFASSLGAEDQVLTALLAEVTPRLPLFTLDTGRLFAEAYDLLQRTEERYGLRIQVYFPDGAAVEQMVQEHGLNLFRKSVANRKLCCGIRKVQPLRRALAGKQAWIVGLRRAQSNDRAVVDTVSWDAANGLYKICPLADWSDEQMWAYIKAHDVPYNPLHDHGFVSIGCACCTRAIAPGEDFRAGRWWWESAEHKECGLHIVDGKVVRPPPPPPSFLSPEAG